MELFAGFLLGIVASGIAAVVVDHATGPKLEIVLDPGPRALGDLPDGTRQEYHHVLVKNSRTKWPLPGRRPAWACQATIAVFAWTGEPLLGAVPIRARWASQPSPVSSFVIGDRIIQAADMAKIIAGRRIDIYTHQDERLTIALKHQGKSELHLFTNESYQFERACNPAWRLEAGTYRLRITLHYELGEIHHDFELGNTGATLEDVKIRPWSGKAVQQQLEPTARLRGTATRRGLSCRRYTGKTEEPQITFHPGFCGFSVFLGSSASTWTRIRCW